MKIKSEHIKYIIAGLLIGFVNGFFGSGGGAVCILFMVLLLNMERHRAHATSIFVIFPITFLSAYFYIKNGIVNWNLTYKVILGGIIGGYIGGKVLHKFSGESLGKIFAILISIAAIKLFIS